MPKRSPKPASQPAVPSRFGPKSEFVRPEIRCKDGRKAGVWCEDRFWHLGSWNGVDPIPTVIYQAWLRLCDYLEERFYAKRAELPVPEEAASITIAEGVDLWLHFLRTSLRAVGGDLRTDGTLADHYQRVIYQLKPLVLVYGLMPVREFTARHLQALIDKMLKATWQVTTSGKRSLDPKSVVTKGEVAKHFGVTERTVSGWMARGCPGEAENYDLEAITTWREKPPKRFSENYANKIRTNILRLFGYLELYDFVDKGTVEHLKTMRALEAEEEERELTFTAQDVAITCDYASPQVAALIELQWITAARPSELCRMQARYIDRTSRRSVWIYRPPKHKTSYRKKKRAIPLNTRCQEILSPFLEARPADDYLFKPAESHAWWQEQRALHAGQNRKTAVYPSEIERRAKAKAARKRRKPARSFAPRFSAYTYAQAVRRAIRKARADNKEVQYWTPYDLRHFRLTDIQYRLGEESSAALGGHSQNINRRYAHKQTERAIKIATRLVGKDDLSRFRQPEENSENPQKRTPARPRSQRQPKE